MAHDVRQKMNQQIYSCLTKVTTQTGDQLKYGPNWIFARRSRLLVFSDRLECGDWIIMNHEMQSAVLYSIRMNIVIPGFVLKIETIDKVYHFGLNYGKFWKGELPFPAQRTKGRMSYSALSIFLRCLRLAALLIFIYLIWGN